MRHPERRRQLLLGSEKLNRHFLAHSVSLHAYVYTSTTKKRHTFVRLVHNPDMDSFGQRIKNLRISRELTQEDVAKHLGVKQGSYTQLERGVSKSASAKNLIALAHLFEVNPEWLLTGEGERQPVQSLSPEESELLMLFRDISPEGRDYILRRTRSVHAEERHGRQARRQTPPPGKRGNPKEPEH